MFKHMFEKAKMRGFLALPMQAERLTAEDICILQLALGDGEIQEQAWRKWQTIADFDALTTGSILIPAAYFHTAQYRSGGPAERMRGAYRKNWLLTKLLQERLMPLVCDIAEAQIPCVLGDDVPLAFEYFAVPSARPVFEITLYCSAPAQAKLAQFLIQRGLKPARSYGWQLTDQAIVRPRIFDLSQMPGGLTDSASLPLPILGAAAQLCCTFRAARPHPLMRFLDMGMVLRAHSKNIDWAEIGGWISQQGKVANFRQLLRFYANTIGLDLPAQTHALMESCSGMSAHSKLARQLRSTAANLRQNLTLR